MKNICPRELWCIADGHGIWSESEYGNYEFYNTKEEAEDALLTNRRDLHIGRNAKIFKYILSNGHSLIS